MFSEKFNPKQQAVFLGLLDRLIMADGVITVHEDVKMREFQAAFPDVIAEDIPDDILRTVFTARRDKVAVLLELLSVALAERSLNKDDEQFLEKLCIMLGLSQRDLGWMQSWVENMIFLIKQANKFMED